MERETRERIENVIGKIRSPSFGGGKQVILVGSYSSQLCVEVRWGTLKFDSISDHEIWGQVRVRV